jgi:hypothetical protein
VPVMRLCGLRSNSLECCDSKCWHRSRGESVHGGASALLHDKRGGSVHGGRTYWRVLRAAATAAKWHNREKCNPRTIMLYKNAHEPGVQHAQHMYDKACEA